MISFSNIQFQINRNIWQLICLLAICISACTGNNGEKNNRKVPSERQDVSQAERFKLDKRNGYTVLTINNPWQGANNINQVFHLLRRGSKLPEGLDSSMVIIVPVKKIICMSTTHVAMISALGEENSIAGVSGPRFIFKKSLIDKVEKGMIEDVGFEANLNKELIIRISPDLIMMYAIGSESAGYVGKLKELGVKVLFNADYLETDPLSRAEWIKLFGALYCKERMADSIYANEVEAYNKMKSFISRNISSKPKVLLGLPFKDTWFVSPGNSFISKMISDAGGDYLWKNTESSISMPFGIENVYMSAITADYWLNIGSVNTKNEISIVDQRLEGLPCFKNGNLYNNNKLITTNGGNDYWETGSIYPHVILKDMASILHPGLFDDYELCYYQKIK